MSTNKEEILVNVEPYVERADEATSRAKNAVGFAAIKAHDLGKFGLSDALRSIELLMQQVQFLLRALPKLVVVAAVLLLVIPAEAQDEGQLGDWSGWSESESHKLDWALRIAAPLAIGADLVTTERALNQPGLVELNPLQQNRWARIGLHFGAAFGVDLIAQKLEKRGERGAARWLRIGVTAGFTALAIRNSQMGSK